MKLPRRLKKKLKQMLLDVHDLNGIWKTSEIRIDGFSPYRFHNRRGVVTLNGKSITSFRLTPQ